MSRALERARGQREGVEQVVAALRRRNFKWREDEAKRGLFAAALLSTFNEQWEARIEGFARELEAYALQLRNAESQVRSEPAKRRRKHKDRHR